MRGVSPNSRLIGFKLLNDCDETDLAETCEKYLYHKRLDMMVGNDLAAMRRGEYYQIHTTSEGSGRVDEDFALNLIKTIELL